MSADGVFVDSNIFLYLLDRDPIKAGRAESIIRAGGVVSAQVLNEIVSVARKKFRAGWPLIHDVLESIRLRFLITPLTFDIHQYAIIIAERDGLNIYDANIVAAAQLAGCHTLLTEDLNPGQRFGGVTIRNPFV